MGPRIQADERGITLNKSLAWSMLGTIVAASIWVGAQIQGTRSAIEKTNSELESLSLTQSNRHVETVQVRRETDARLRAVENAQAVAISENTALRRDLTNESVALRRELSQFRGDMQELKQLLRDVQTGLRGP